MDPTTEFKKHHDCNCPMCRLALRTGEFGLFLNVQDSIDRRTANVLGRTMLDISTETNSITAAAALCAALCSVLCTMHGTEADGSLTDGRMVIKETLYRLDPDSDSAKLLQGLLDDEPWKILQTPPVRPHAQNAQN